MAILQAAGIGSPMKLLGIVLFTFLLIIGGAFCYLALANVPVPQKQITKVIPNDRFFGQKKT